MTYGPLNVHGTFDLEKQITTPPAPQAGHARLGIGNDLVLRWVDSNGTVYSAASGNALTAHLTETNPFEHTAGSIQTTLGNVQNDLDALDEQKADNSAVDAALKAVSSSPTTVNRNTSVSEETLFSFSMPSGTLTSDGSALIVEASGDILANSGSPTWMWKLKSGTVVLDSPATAMAINANLRRWKLLFTILRTTVASQVLTATLFVSNPTATTDFNTIDPLHCFVGNTTDFAATDFGAAITIAFTVQMSVSNINNRTRMYGYNARKVRSM